MIELKIDEFKEGKVIFHISRQDEEDYEKLRYKPFLLTLSDGKVYGLFSDRFPQYYERHRRFFVRGREGSENEKEITVKLTDYLNIIELLQFYHKTS